MNIRKMIFELVGCTFFGEVHEVETEGVYVKYENGLATVGGNTIPAKCRAYTLFAKLYAEGKEAFEISQKPSFDMLGAMIDMSRGGVMKPESVKKYLRYMAAYGMNTLMLYTEDTYEVEEYPNMGYQRGRYTIEELRQIDDYAAELGIEVIPCIQTLGHMEQFLRNEPSLKDTDRILLVGNEKTYEFIEACIRAMRKAFRSKRIHIGCDETKGLGTGNYLIKNGYNNRFEIFSGHVEKVAGICHKYNFRPMIWSDMYYAFAGNEHSDYNPNVKIPQYAIDGMPDVDMVFWDYYNTDNDFYRKNLEIHKTFNRKIVFAGGIWTWDGFVPNYRFTYETMKPALEECLRAGTKEVLATLWSNDGCETSHMLGIPMLSMFSEYCWHGEVCTEEDIWEMAAFVTGLTKELANAVSDFFFDYEGAVRAGKLILWSDPLLKLLRQEYDYEEGIRYLENGLKVFEKYENTEYFKAVFQAALDKCILHKELPQRYKSRDREWLKRFSEEDIPKMIADFENLYQLHYSSWYRDYKTYGFERIMQDYAGAIERLRYAAKTIRDYANNEIDCIEELEQDEIHVKKVKWKKQTDVMLSYRIIL